MNILVVLIKEIAHELKTCFAVGCVMGCKQV